MLSKELMKTPAYKIMISLAICDILSVIVNSIVTGIFGYFGLTFCHFPMFVFICGAHGFGCWLGCSITCVTLAVCRISEMNPKLYLFWIFRGLPMKLVLGWFVVTVLYGTYFTKPVIFRIEFMSWFFDPGVGLKSDLYTNTYHTVNNIAQAFLTSTLYTVLCFSVYCKSSHNNHLNSTQLSYTQKMFCYQAATICMAHNVSSSVYVYMQFFYTPPWLIVAEQIGWQMCTGGVCLVYIVFNRTIRVSVKDMLGLRSWNNTVSLHAHSSASVL
ncbi:unnamed protein product [Caenorhabditis sp. 36 PRJEB53466]|nr:unnamed protein product [Caenorhabditis sp. 36 PRJEB53466]